MVAHIQRYVFCIATLFSLFIVSLNTYGQQTQQRYKPLDEEMPILQLTVSCRSCHGNEGKTPMFPGIPTIGFQDREYLVMSLRAFKYGERAPKLENSPLGIQMIQIAAMLSDENIERVADYFATRPVWDMSQPVEYPASYVYPNGYGE